MTRNARAVLHRLPPKAAKSMRQERQAGTIVWIAWSTVAVVTVLRLIFAARLPLTGDEAYYWEWSRRLAAGYTDHPPAIAFAIAAFAWLGASPFAVRLPFVLCGVGAALACGGAANEIAGDRRAGAIAALGVTLAPIVNVAFATATPDGPYAFFWALTLYAAVRAQRTETWLSYVWLGIAMGGALLSRLFGLALVFGVAAAGWRRKKTWVAIAVGFALWGPFLWWNANHHWISFTFALVQRHELQVQILRPVTLYALAALAFSPGFWIAATIAAARPKYTLLAWTSIPLSVAFLLLAARERVEVYWFIGPYVSLCVAVGCAYARWSVHRQRVSGRWIALPAAVLTALIFFTGIVPKAVYALLHDAGLKLSDGGPFEMFTYPQLARDVARVTRRRNAIVMTDGYGFSSVLDFYGGLEPVVIGYAAQGEEAHGWYAGPPNPRPALFVDKVPLDTRPDFLRQLHLACAHVAAGPTFSYAFSQTDRGIPPRRYYSTWCEQVSPRAIAILRWELSMLREERGIDAARLGAPRGDRNHVIAQR